LKIFLAQTFLKKAHFRLGKSQKTITALQKIVRKYFNGISKDKSTKSIMQL